MDKEQFLSYLRSRIGYLPDSEVEKSVSFYAECIDDRMEDGMSEAEAVAALGNIESIIREIETSQPLSTVVKRRVSSSETRGGGKAVWIALAVLGIPFWLPVLLALCIVILAAYVCIWSIVLSIYAVLLALAVSGAALVVYAILRIAALSAGAALMVLGAAAVCVGLAIALFIPLSALAKKIGSLTVRFGRWLKSIILGKGVYTVI